MSKAREALAGKLYEAHRRAEGRWDSTPWTSVVEHYSTSRDEWLAVADAAIEALAAPEPEAAPAAQAAQAGPVAFKRSGSSHQSPNWVTFNVRAECADEAERRLSAPSRKPSQAGPVQGEWISAEERLPEDEVRVLGWTGTQNGIAYRCRGDWASATLLHNPTHWMPLPPPPAAPSEGQQPGGAPE